MTMLQMMTADPCEAVPALAGTWELAAGRAVTLEPLQAGALKVAQGRIWATRQGPHAGAANDRGDLVLGAGAQVVLHAGQRLVIEPWNHGAPVYFSWQPSPAPQPRTAASSSLELIAPPLADLRAALASGAGAMARLLAGVAQVGWQLLSGAGQAGLPERACREGRGAG